MLSSRQTRRALAICATALLLAACGHPHAPGEQGEGPASADVAVGLVDFEIRLSAAQLLATTVSFTVTNAGGTEHDLQVVHDDEVLAATRVLDPGEQETITADLTGRSSVTLLCKFAGHDLMGMSTEVPVIEPDSPPTALVLQEASTV